jgi:hypothetical protein
MRIQLKEIEGKLVKVTGTIEKFTEVRTELYLTLLTDVTIEIAESRKQLKLDHLHVEVVERNLEYVSVGSVASWFGKVRSYTRKDKSTDYTVYVGDFGLTVIIECRTAEKTLMRNEDTVRDSYNYFLSPNGVNRNFMKIISKNRNKVRTVSLSEIEAVEETLLAIDTLTHGLKEGFYFIDMVDGSPNDQIEWLSKNRRVLLVLREVLIAWFDCQRIGGDYESIKYQIPMPMEKWDRPKKSKKSSKGFGKCA